VSKRVAAIQSNYIPWKGYFDAINVVDEFVLLDEVQYTKRDWRNRNRIKSPAGTQWLTIPVAVKGRYHQRIDETRVSDPEWGPRHFSTLKHVYRRAPYFDWVADAVEPLYEQPASERLSEINRAFLETICALLGIETALRFSTDYETSGTRGDRILELVRAAGADEYVSGPAARSYLDESAFAAEGVAVHWLDYSGYPEYTQFGTSFEHGVTVLDLLFHTGPDAPTYLKTLRGEDGGLI
jgi:hypothetical protein